MQSEIHAGRGVIIAGLSDLCPVSIPTRWISDSDALGVMAEAMAARPALAFDTEFDSFRRSYGFTLLLIQVFDGEVVYLIDPLALSDLAPLWRIMEDPAVRKVGYALGEDVRLMKTQGCAPRNLVDVQVARQLSNRTDAGLARALEEDLGVILHKASQTSDWSKRPLTEDQLDYLTNDVVHLFRLEAGSLGYRTDAYLSSVFAEEMQLLEAVDPAPHVVQLTRAQVKKYAEPAQEALLSLLKVRDGIARALQLPPNFVVNNDLLESLMDQRDAFLAAPFVRGFHPKVRARQDYRKAFLDAVRAIPDEVVPRVRISTRTREEKVAFRQARLDREALVMNKVMPPLEASLRARYEEEVVRFLLRGVRKTIGVPEPDYAAMRPYQWALVRPYLEAALPSPGGS